MTMTREWTDEEFIIPGSDLLDASSGLSKASGSDSSEGELEIKRVTWSAQKKPEAEVESTKARLRMVSREWENSKDHEIMVPDSEIAMGRKMKKKVVQDGEEEDEDTATVDADDDDDVSEIHSRLATRCPSFVDPTAPQSMSYDASELAELQERNRFLEASLKKSTLENEELKREFEEERNNLLDKIECLELANEQLLAGGENSGMEQLQMELTRLQKHNTVLSQRERELQFQLSTKDMLQKEVQHLQELNEQLLDTRLPAEPETESNGKMLERIVTLETELAEALEVNTLYKSHLHTAFAEQQNVQGKSSETAAAGGEAAADDEKEKLREQNKTLEADLQDLRDRYFVMSIRLAESEAQHEEQMMKAKRVQSPYQKFGGSFKW